MQATQTASEGLKREFKVVVPATELETRLTNEIAGLKDKVQLKGFRPGKVPPAHLRRVYGRSIMADVVQNTVNESTRKIVEENSLKLAYEPKVTLPEAQEEIEAVMDAKADLSYTVALEILPTFELADLSGVSLVKDVAEVSDAEIDDALRRLAEQNRAYAARPEGEAAAEGDRLKVDFIGRIDGEAFEGGSAEDIEVQIGANAFIPGFEEQLVGIRAGETKTISVTFPEQYQAAHLAGKAAEFEVTAKSVEAPQDAKIDDDLGKAFGMENLEALRKALRERIGQDFEGQSRRKLKKKLLDALDGLYSFELPPTLVSQEFDNVWAQVVEDMKQAGKSFEDEGTTEEAAKAEYLAVAERRVRLGLVLAETGEKAEVKVNDDEVTQALVARARQFPGQEKLVWDYYRNNPQALAELRAPIFEDKVVDHLLGQVKIEENKVSKEALFADDEEEDGKAKGGKSKSSKKA